MLVQLGLSFARVRFDGALDSHPAGPAGVSLGAALLDAVVSWPLTAAVFWLGALVVARQGRFVDFLGAVGVARMPMVFSGAVLALVEAYLPITRPGPHHGAGIAVLTALSLPCIVWFFALLFQGFRTASGLRGPRVGVSFVVVLVVAEFVSKLVLRLS